MKTFIRVYWHHDFEDEPVILVSEIVDRVETRKVEVYRNGRMDYSDGSLATGTTRLSEVLMPSVAEIADHPEFSPEVIDAKGFEDIWNQALQQK
ncbi:DUF6881 domain-containing protein [Paenarthrobacter sp. NPDC056912]|uniref:DUF6881 domain-containing protein n=1 Tax=Paenarthrobacter sp. NPDC056912 TaxID=3345965 RepID=UPI00367060F3